MHFDVFLYVLGKLRQDIEEIVMNEQLIKRLVQINYGDVNEMPKFRFNPMTDDQKLELNQLFVDAVSKGVVDATQMDQNAIRENLHFPIQTDVQSPPEQEGLGEEPILEDAEEMTTLNSQLDLRPTEAMAKEGELSLIHI